MVVFAWVLGALLSGTMVHMMDQRQINQSKPSGKVHFDGQRETLLALFGFACNQAFLYSLLYMGLNRYAVLGSITFERVDALFALLAAAVVFIVLRCVAEAVRDAILSTGLIWCYAFLMALGSAVSLPDANALVSVSLEGLIVGVPLGCMLAMWGRILVGLSHSSSVRVVVLATALAAVISFLLYLVGMVWEPFLYLVDAFPFLSALALRILLPRCKDAAASSSLAAGGSSSFDALVASSEQVVKTQHLSRKCIAGTLLFGVSGGLMETYASDPGMVATPTFPATLLLLALLCAGSLQIVGVPKPGSRDERNRESDTLVGVYRLVTLVMLAGFLFVPVLKPFGVPGDAIVLAGYLALTAVLVSLFILTAKLSDLDGALAFSRGFSSLYLGEAAGLALGNALEALSLTGEAPYAVASCAGFCTLFAFLYLFKESDFRELTHIVEQADRFEDACASIAARCKLSKREGEILPMALRGRTGERIAGELFISKSTVDTHLRRIYAKCGVHSRQELIDLGESEIRSLSEH